MRRTRVIPVLLLRNGRLEKTTRFRDPRYVGDPVNTVRLFNEKAVDEILVLDVAAGARGGPDLATLGALAAECFMPLAYGGGIRTLAHAASVFELGVEKVVLGEAALTQPQLLGEVASRFGQQSVVVCIDVAKGRFGGQRVVTGNGRRKHQTDPVALARASVERGAGELVVQSVDRDGTGAGYDLGLVRSIADAVDVPVIACGGAGSLEDLRSAVVEGHASAAAAGSFFTFHGRHRAVLVTYPTEDVLEELLP